MAARKTTVVAATVASAALGRRAAAEAAPATQKMMRKGKNGSASRGDSRIQKLAMLMANTAVATAQK